MVFDSTWAAAGLSGTIRVILQPSMTHLVRLSRPIDMSESERIWVVDRGETGVAVLIADDNEQTVDVQVSLLPENTSEGSVLLVPEQVGEPAWSSSRLDEEQRQNRLREAEVALNELRKRDPGGDISL